MAELLALTGLAVGRYRALLYTMVGLIVSGLFGTLLSIRIFGEEIGLQVGGYAMFFSLLPSAVAALLLFDYGLNNDLSMPETGCSQWILSLPISPWKIAAVPVVLKTIWMSILWMMFSIPLNYHGQRLFPIWLPCVSFSSVAIWVMVLSWRPFSRGFYKVFALIVLLPVSYCVVVGGFAAHFFEEETWRATALGLSWIATVVFYLSGTICLIQSTSLARVTPRGMIRAAPGAFWRTTPCLDAPGYQIDRRMDLSGCSGSFGTLKVLFWYDYIASVGWIRQVYLMGVIPGTLVYGLLVPINVISVIGLFFGIVYLSMLVNSKTMLRGTEGTGSLSIASELPIHLTASPLTTRDLAWCRQLFPLALASLTYLWIFVVIAGWCLRGSNRQIWFDWAAVQAVALEFPDQTLLVGLRLSAALIFGIGLLVTTRMIAYAWVPASGRSWVAISHAVYSLIIVFGPVVVFLAWFLQQKDWETTRQGFAEILSFLPSLAVFVLVAKSICFFFVTFSCVRKKLIDIQDILISLLGWFVLVLGVGFLFSKLMPFRFATPTACIVVAMVVFPIARWFLLPLSLDWNRHR